MMGWLVAQDGGGGGKDGDEEIRANKFTTYLNNIFFANLKGLFNLKLYYVVVQWKTNICILVPAKLMQISVFTIEP